MGMGGGFRSGRLCSPFWETLSNTLLVQIWHRWTWYGRWCFGHSAALGQALIRQDLLNPLASLDISGQQHMFQR